MRTRNLPSLLLCLALSALFLLTGCAASISDAPATSAAPAASSTVSGAPDTTAVPSGTAAATVCSLSVRCDTILDNMDKLDPDKTELVPEDGLLYENASAAFTEGESVLDVLVRELKSAKIHFEYVATPAYGTTYIEGIGNLYEFDCGELSGWTYRVNGEFISRGCSECLVQPGDTIEFLYTCDLGADVGDVYVGE
ncbi:MAG: DUF4430 domain-containing protein [Eubacteriales bacterium]